MKRIFSLITSVLCAIITQADTFNLYFHADSLVISQIRTDNFGEYCKIKFGDLLPGEQIGFPELPKKYIFVEIPTNAEKISLSAQGLSSETYPLGHKIYPVQESMTTSLQHEEWGFTPCVDSIYNSSANYPLNIATIKNISAIGDEKQIVCIEVNPVIYHPSDNNICLYKHVELKLNYKTAAGRINKSNVTVRNHTNLPFYEYAIITNRELSSAFSRMIAWLKESGYNAGIVHIEDILNNPNIQGDTISSLYDDAGKLRQYLQYAYRDGGTRFVLLGGNKDIIPIRYGTGRNNSWTHSNDTEALHIPADFYYSELHSNWNQDNDQYLGEPNSSMDYGSELMIGRIQCQSSTEIENYTDKLLRYELNPGNGDYSYLQKAFFSEADQMQRDNEAKSVINEILDIFPDTTLLSEYPSYNASNTTYPTGNDIIEVMNQNYGYVSWCNHGNPTSITAKSNEIGLTPYGMSSVCGNIPWIVQETANGLDSLKNKDYPMIAYSIACTITPFDTYSEEYAPFPNIGQSFTLGKDYGGPALIGNTRVGWVNTTYLVQKKFNTYIRNNSIGMALNLTKLYNNADRHHHAHTVNIIGCPSICIWTAAPQRFSATLSPENMLNIGHPQANSSVSLRKLKENGDSIMTIPINSSSYNLALNPYENSVVTLNGRNCLPQILPTYLQNFTLQGSRYLIVSDMTCGKNIRTGDEGNVVFEQGSVTEIEKSGNLILGPGTIVKSGATLRVKQSNINF